MSVEAIQCPKCGGPLSVEEGRDSVYCSHCGAGLIISTGSSGHAMATLADIKDDTSLLAMRAALERLEERLRERDNQLRQLENARAEAWENCEAEQQRQEQRQANRTAKVSDLRSQFRAGAAWQKVLWSGAALLLGAAVFLSICLWAYFIVAGPTGGAHEWIPALVTLFVILGGVFLVLAFLRRAERPKIAKLLERTVQDEEELGAESTNQKHKERLQRLDAELAEVRSQIQGIERQRDALRAKLDGLTDQL